MTDRNDAAQATDGEEEWGWEFVAERAWLAHSQIQCYACSALTPVIGFYVRGAIAHELGDPGDTREVDGFLHYVTKLDADAELFAIRARARLWPDHSRTAGQRYWMNHCEQCGSAQGDHFVFSSPGEGFFPTDEAGARALRYERLPHTLRATGSVGEVSFGPAEEER